MNTAILESKAAMRKKLAALPIEEKFKILEELYARAKAIKKCTSK